MATEEQLLALEQIIKSASKKFSKEFGGKDWGDIEAIPTGSTALDIALGIGGFPRGRVIEVYGWESSGKTSLSLSVIAQAQQIRREKGTFEYSRDLIVDLEHSLTRAHIEGQGVDVSKIIWERPDTAEEALQMCIDYPKSGAIDIVLLDSVDALQNERQLSRSVGEIDVGGISKDMSQSMRTISKLAPKQDTTYIFINQIRQNPGKSYGDSRVTPGGNALKFYASLRLELMAGQPSENLPNALNMRVKVIKTKIASPYGKEPISLDFVYGKGFDPIFDLMTLAKSLGLIRYAGSACKVLWPGETEEVNIALGGKKGLAEALAEPELFNRLKAACYQHTGLT